MSGNLLTIKKYNSKEAAELLGISQRLIQQLASIGTIRSYKLGRKVVFLEVDLEQYLRSCQQNPARSESHKTTVPTLPVRIKPKHLAL